MFVHAVYFWLKPDISTAQQQQFVELATAMSKAPTVRHLWVGRPAPTDRPVIDRSYSYSLVVVFDDAAGEAAYQVHSSHDTFREKCGSFWTRVQIYDSL